MSVNVRSPLVALAGFASAVPSTVTRRASIASLTETAVAEIGSGSAAGPRTRSPTDEAAHLQLAVRVGKAAGHLDARAAHRPRVQVADPDDDRRRRVLDREQRRRPEPPGFGRDDATDRHAAADREGPRLGDRDRGRGRAAGGSGSARSTAPASASASGSGSATVTGRRSGAAMGSPGRSAVGVGTRARRRRRRRERRVDGELAGQRGVEAIAGGPVPLLSRWPSGPAAWTTSPVCDRRARPGRQPRPRSGADRSRRRS